MYSREDRLKTVQVYVQYDHVIGPVLLEVRYPLKGAPGDGWAAEYETTGDLHTGYQRERHHSKYIEDQKRAVNDCFLTVDRVQKSVRT